MDHPTGKFWHHPDWRNSVAVQAWSGTAGVLGRRRRRPDLARRRLDLDKASCRQRALAAND
ncbi:MAG: hypothetical protein K9G48_13495 [Reyranella sp.]|nr:hypothetical protein [Reyranella sp.]